jgi:hypothetical protein
MPRSYGVLQVYEWVSPETAKRLPEWVRARLAVIRGDGVDFELSCRRAALLDLREWFNGAVRESTERCR